MRAAFTLASMLFLLAGGAVGGAAPKRVVSLNPCLDAILLEVADPSQIAALSRYSREPSQSAVADRARRFPFTYGSAEEIVALQPDLVLGSGMGGSQLAHVLPGLRIEQANFQVPKSVDESLAQVTRVAALVGHPARGAALNARIQKALAASAPRLGERRFKALIYEYHGVASGPHTLMSEIMARAGFDNAALDYGVKRTGDVPLETLIANPPQVLLAGRLAPNEPTWADRVLSHPALRSLQSRMLRESFPETLMFCGGPVMIPAAAALTQARLNAERGLSR